MGLLSRLALSDRGLGEKLFEALIGAGGAGVDLVTVLLDAAASATSSSAQTVSNEAIIDAGSLFLSVISSWARGSAKSYNMLRSVGAIKPVCKCLSAVETGIRAKACNALGNLLRHSSEFYRDISSCEGASEALIRCLSDPDPQVRKFGCFGLVSLTEFHS